MKQHKSVEFLSKFQYFKSPIEHLPATVLNLLFFLKCLLYFKDYSTLCALHMLPDKSLEKSKTNPHLTPVRNFNFTYFVFQVHGQTAKHADKSDLYTIRL